MRMGALADMEGAGRLHAGAGGLPFPAHASAHQDIATGHSNGAPLSRAGERS